MKNSLKFGNLKQSVGKNIKSKKTMENEISTKNKTKMLGVLNVKKENPKV